MTVTFFVEPGLGWKMGLLLIIDSLVPTPRAAGMLT